jgi:hypothetical protein
MIHSIGINSIRNVGWIPETYYSISKDELGNSGIYSELLTLDERDRD